MAKKFTKTDINFWLDTALLVVFMVLCWETVIVRYVFPAPHLSGGWSLWGLDYLDWLDIQFVTLSLLSAGILLHVMLHWSWVCGVAEGWVRKRKGITGPKQDDGSRTIWGVALLIAICNLVGLGIAAAVLTVQSPPL